MLRDNIIAIIWSLSDISCCTFFTLPSPGNKSRLQTENRSINLCKRWKRQLVTKIFTMASQRNLQHILIRSVLPNLETSLNIPTYAESSTISLAGKVLNGIKCLIGQFWNTQWLNHQSGVAVLNPWKVCGRHCSTSLQEHHCRILVSVYRLALSFSIGRH